MSWISDILQLLNVRQERKKRRLEVEKLEKESSVIQIATDEQIAAIDPKRRALLMMRKSMQESRRHTRAVGATIIIAVLVLVVFFRRC